MSDALDDRIGHYRNAVLEALGSAGWEINSDDELTDALRLLNATEAPGPFSFEGVSAVAGLPVAEVPATNDPAPNIDDATGRRVASGKPLPGCTWSPRPEFDAEIPVDEGALWLEAVNRALYRYDSEKGFGVREVAASLAAELQKARAEGAREALGKVRSRVRIISPYGHEVTEGMARAQVSNTILDIESEYPVGGAS